MSNMEHTALEKTLSPTQVWALALGSIAGWGCFVLPGDKFLPEAGPLATLIGFAIGALLLCFVAISYSYMIQYARSPAANTHMLTSATAPQTHLSAGCRRCQIHEPRSPKQSLRQRRTRRTFPYR